MGFTITIYGSCYVVHYISQSFKKILSSGLTGKKIKILVANLRTSWPKAKNVDQ